MNAMLTVINGLGRSAAFRMTMALLLILPLFLSVMVLSEQALAADIEILTPRPQATVYARHPETHLVIRQVWRQGVDRVRVTQGELSIEPVVIRQHQGHDYLHFRLPLKRGKNNYTLLPGGLRVELNYRPIQAELNLDTLSKDAYLFHRDERLPADCVNCHELQRTASIGAVGIEKQLSCVLCHKNMVDKAPYQHSTTINRQCLACHQQFVKPWRIGFPAIRTEEICLTCHTGKKVWRTQSFVHGPMNAGGCTLCHNPHGGDYPQQLWAEGSVELCIACHSDKEDLVDGKNTVPVVHGIIEGGGCVACHDPHAGDYAYMLKQPINQFCVGCHIGLAGVTRGHPVGGHPVAGPHERRRPGRELNCVSCHDPHGSSFRKLLIGDPRGGHVCIACHR